MPKKIPRYYQQGAFDAIIEYFNLHKSGVPLINLPTGAGKSLVIAMLADHFQKGVLVVTHSKEIIKQNYQSITTYFDEKHVGIYSAGLKRKERRKITVASVQSIAHKLELFQNYSLVVIDEAQLVPHKGEGRYRTLFKEMPNARFVGLTGSPYRLGQGMLMDGSGALFDALVYQADVEKLIAEGYLSPLRTQSTDTQFDVSDVSIRGGEFVDRELDLSVNKQSKNKAVTKEICTYKNKYNHILIFAVSIDHASKIQSLLQKQGMATTVVHSKLKHDERDERISAFKNGEFQAVVNVGILSVGFDFPNIDLIAILRPTRSPVFYVQIVGRGLRPVYADNHPLITQDDRVNAIKAGTKPHCLVLDFAQVIETLGPINDIIVPETKESNGKGEAPVKACPECKMYVPAGVRICPYCGHKFPLKNKLTNTASTSIIIGTRHTKKWYDITKITYNQHLSKKSGGLSMKVTYICGIRVVHEWVSIGSPTSAGNLAKHWWTQRTLWRTHPQYAYPADVPSAVKRANNNELREPCSLLVDDSGKYPSIEQVKYLCQ